MHKERGSAEIGQQNSTAADEGAKNDYDDGGAHEKVAEKR